MTFRTTHARHPPRRRTRAPIERKTLRFSRHLCTRLLPAVLVAVATVRAAVMVAPDPPPPPDPAPVVPSPPAGWIAGLPSCCTGEGLAIQNLDIFIEEVRINGLPVPFDLLPDSQHHLEYVIAVPPGTTPGIGVVRIVLEDGGVLHVYAQFLPPEPPALTL